MKFVRRVGVIGCFAVLSACTAPGDAQRPAVVAAAVGKVIESLATEATQRQASDGFRGLPLVVRNSGASGAGAVLAELLRTRLVERGLPLEAACPAKCLEITLLEFEVEATGQAAPGQLLAVNAGAVTGLTGLPRAPGSRGRLAAGEASALLATFAARDGNRYNGRQQLVVVLAVARSPESAR